MQFSPNPTQHSGNGRRGPMGVRGLEMGGGKSSGGVLSNAKDTGCEAGQTQPAQLLHDGGPQSGRFWGVMQTKGKRRGGTGRAILGSAAGAAACWAAGAAAC